MDSTEASMNEAIRRIDARFEPGYAMAHPALLGAFMQTAAMEMLAAATQEQADAIDRATEG
jgi:hypothetical protein